MSASLVGSEMCIRDRCRHVEEEPATGQGRRAKALERGAQRIPKRNPTKPVSYTHLTLPTICSV
eukprot:153294-Alexandrium_andersonii.AAC.1